MKMDSVIFQAALLLGFGYTTIISANFEITTTGNSGEGFSQGSEAILTCTINPYTGSQTWKVNDVSVAECGFVVCSENISNPERYSFTPNISTGAFIFTINPVKYADDGNIDCFDGSNTKTFTMVVTDPVVITNTGARITWEKCRILLPSVGIIFLCGIAQSTCLGYIIFGICQKGGIKNIDGRCCCCLSIKAVTINIAISSVPFFGLFSLSWLVWRLSQTDNMKYWNGRRSILRFIPTFVPVVFIVPAVINLWCYRKYWKKATSKVLPVVAIVFIFFFTVAPFVLAVLECWDKVPQISSELRIFIIIFAYYFVIWVAVIFELSYLQYFEAVKFKVKSGSAETTACMSCQVVNICKSCRMDLCKTSLNKHRSHTLWKRQREEITCELCKKKDVNPARCVCLKCKKASCVKHFGDHSCEHKPLWSKHKQEWPCKYCQAKYKISAENICLECKTAFCGSCHCRCSRGEVRVTKDELTKDCKHEFCEHLYPDVCLKCMTAICRDCSYLHFMKCLDPTLIWRNPQQALCSNKRNGNDEKHTKAENICLDCNAALCRGCSVEHEKQCVKKGVVCGECRGNDISYMKVVCLGCGKIVCKRCSKDHFKICNEAYSAHIHPDCNECIKQKSNEADRFCTYCRTFICTSCLLICNSHRNKVWSTENQNLRCQSCKCPVHGYCITCSRTACLTCFQSCQLNMHDLITDERISTTDVLLIATGCLALFTIIVVPCCLRKKFKILE